MYSKASAISTTSRTRVSSIDNPCSAAARSGVLEDDLVDDIAGIAATVDRLFQQFEQVFQQQDADRLVAAAIEIAVQLEQQAIGFVLDRLQAIVERAHRLEVHA